jgi:hypothetical protein
MKFSKNILYLFYLVLLLSNCVQEFNPPSQGYDNLLVIEAFLSDSEDPFEVKLSRSTPIDTSAFIPESGASVRLSSDSGEEYALVESVDPGVYLYNGPIHAQIGKSYQIHVGTRNGNQYESSMVTMRETPEIDSVSFRFEEQASASLKGVQIYIDTHDPANNTWYYRWEWDEAWMFQTPYDSYLIWDNGQILPRDERINTCWKFGRSTSIDLSTTKNLSVDNISDYPLLYVSDQSDRLKLKYSINVKQYALSEESYNYWLELQKATESLGTLFDPQPTIVQGNIYNINDESDLVLGYFDASSVREKRIFITRGGLPPMRLPNYYAVCTDSIVSRGAIQEMEDQNWLLVSETTNEAGFPAYLMSYPWCIDCTLHGTNKRPDFWE